MRKNATLILILFAVINISCKKDKSFKNLDEVYSIKLKGNLNKKISDSIDDKTIYDFINYCFDNECEIFKDMKYISEKSLTPYYLSTPDSIALRKMNFLSDEDFEFIYQQHDSSHKFRLNPNLIKKGKQIIPIDTIVNVQRERRFYNKKYKGYEEGFSSIELPLFSKDRKYVIVQCVSGGKIFAGKVGLFVYQKLISEKKWTLFKTLKYKEN